MSDMADQGASESTSSQDSDGSESFNLRPIMDAAEELAEDDDICLYQEDIGSLCFANFEAIRQRELLCDVTIKVEGRSFMAHRVILAATIPYFNTMFTNEEFVEARQNEIELTTISAEAFNLLLQYAYTGSIRIARAYVENLMVAASYLQLSKVTDGCCQYLKNKLTADNVLGILHFSDHLGCQGLVQHSTKFIQQHFEEVAVSDEFLTLPFEEVEALVSKNELNITGEDKVFEAVMRWVKKDQASREICLPVLLAQVRLPLLSPHYLADQVATEVMIKNSHKCRDLLDEARDYHLMPERRILLQNTRTRPRSIVIGYIYAVGGLARNGDSLSTVEVYNPETGHWQMAEQMSMLRSRVGVAVMGKKLYAIGGYNGSERLNTVEVFDSEAKTWTKVAPMRSKRSAVGAATLNDSRLFVCGGYDGISSLNTVETFDTTTGEWTEVAEMALHRSAGGVVAFDGKIYALGGHDGLSIFDSVEVYDPKSNQWKFAPSMITRRCRLGATVLKGKIYACGGYNGQEFLQSAEVFDPQTQTWSPIADMNVQRSRVALVANCGKLYSIGGYDGTSNLKSVECYDPETNKWELIEPMSAHEGGVGVGVIPCSPCALKS